MFRKIWLLFWQLIHPFRTPVMIGMCMRMPKHKNWQTKKRIYGKWSEYKTSNWHASGIHHGKETSEWTYLAKKHSFRWLMCPFWTLVRMGIYISMLRLKKWKRWHLGYIVKISNKNLAYKCPSSWKLSFKGTFFSQIWPLFSR